MKPAGIIFDFDGVVVDSLAVHLTAWQSAYHSLFGETLSQTSGLAGRSTFAIAEILCERAGAPHQKLKLADLKRQVLKESQSAILPIPGALEAFAWLKREGIPFGIASNAPRAFILQTLKSLATDIDHVFGIDDVPRPKPEPDGFLLCARTIGISFLDHERTIVFEDSVHGLKAAVSAGMHPIGVTTQNTAAELKSGGARKACKDIAEAFANGWFHDI